MDTLNIFVSGTIDDMLSERKAVGDAIRSLHLDAVRAETEYSENCSSRVKCAEMAHWCDIYLGVYNQTRYGWTIPTDGISVTEMEFNEAQARNKPTLILVSKLPPDWKPKDDKEKEQHAKQTAFLNRVLDFDGGKFRAPEFETLAQLENQVACSLMNLLVERFKMSVTRPPFLAPRNLDIFVGRDKQIEELTTALSRGETALVHGLYGVGGLGKTALALHLAHKLRGAFDGGILWADLPTARPAETLAAWAREYGVDFAKIEEVAARADALRDLMRGKRVLAVLDGAVEESDDEKIAPLLRALPDCAVIVTSRATQLASLRTAKRVDLDKMSEDEAYDLFVRVTRAGGATPPLQRNLVIQIGQTLEFLPLALDLAAAQLREHTRWTLADLLKMLQDERKRLPTLTWGSAGVRAAFNQSYDRLHPDEQKFFAALGAFAGDDFDARAAAFVGETTPDAASAWLERFLRLSLAQEGRRALRYRLHPLLRDYARENCQLTIANYQLRMARYYCALARENGRKLQTDIETALPILDADIGNIYAGQKWARRHDNQVGWELCRDYIYGAMTYYFDLRAMWNDWIEWGEQGLQACRKLGDERGEGAIAGNLGLVYMYKGEWDKAIEFYQNVLATMEKVGDVHGMAHTYNNLGLVYMYKGEWDKAIEFYQKSLVTYEKVGDVHGMAQTYNNLGLVYADKGEWDKATEFYQKDLAISEKVGDVHGMAQTYTNLGNVYQGKGEWDKAIEFYRDALVTMEKVGDVHGMAQTYTSLGVVYRRKGEWDKAIEFYQKSLGICEKVGDVHGMAHTYNNLGLVYMYKGEWDKAIEFYQKSLVTYEKVGDVVGLSRTWWNLAEIYEKQGKVAQAIELMEKTVGVRKKIGHPDAAKDEAYVAQLKQKSQANA